MDIQSVVPQLLSLWRFWGGVVGLVNLLYFKRYNMLPLFYYKYMYVEKENESVRIIIIFLRCTSGRKCLDCFLYLQHLQTLFLILLSIVLTVQQSWCAVEKVLSTQFTASWPCNQVYFQALMKHHTSLVISGHSRMRDIPHIVSSLKCYSIHDKLWKHPVSMEKSACSWKYQTTSFWCEQRL